MSNDTKFWIARMAALAGLLGLGSVMTRMMQEFMRMSDPTAHAHPMLWFGLFILAVAVLLPVGFWYRRAKAERYDPAMHKDQSQIDVETLSAYVSQQRKQDRTKKKDD